MFDHPTQAKGNHMGLDRLRISTLCMSGVLWNVDIEPIKDVCKQLMVNSQSWLDKCANIQRLQPWHLQAFCLSLCVRVMTPWSVLHVWTLSFPFIWLFFSLIIPVPQTLTSKCILPGAREAGSLKNVVFPLRRPNADVQPLCQELASLSLSHQSQDSFTQPSILAQTLRLWVCVFVLPLTTSQQPAEEQFLMSSTFIFFTFLLSLSVFHPLFPPFIRNDRWALTIMDNYSNDKLNLVNGEDLTLGFSGFHSCGRANQKHAFSIK